MWRGRHLRLLRTQFPRLNDGGIRFLSVSRGCCCHYWNIRLQRHWFELSPRKYFRSALLNPTHNHVFALRSSTIAAINNSNGEAIPTCIGGRSELMKQSRNLKVVYTSRYHDEIKLEKDWKQFEILNKESMFKKSKNMPHWAKERMLNFVKTHLGCSKIL